jgi:hypothetical protein
VTLALEQPAVDTLTLDYLELFEMLLEKIGQGCLPKLVADKFETIVSKNWNNYTHEHYFTIERIVNLINESHMLTLRKKPLPSLADLFRSQQEFEITRNPSSYDPIYGFLKNLAWNLVFQHVETGTTVKIVLNIFGNLGPLVDLQAERVEAKIVSCLQILLYIYEDDDALVEFDVDKIISSLIDTVGRQNTMALWKVWGLCLEYLSKVPHSINLLKLSLSDILSKGFRQKEWLSNVTDILEIVVESKPKAIGNFKLQQVLKSILIRLIALEKEPIEEYLDLLDVLFSTEGDYQTFLGHNLKLLDRILTAER